ncbi:MAG: aminoacyl-tRNA hydrolase [Lachnospiraceae bacterium]|nr:aminoacyl-tRNA hydrolase [Lachnospiraceae bacterium]
MYLIVGLGNPGREYEKTRHNVGFDTIDELVEEYRIDQSGVKFKAMYGKGMIGGEKVILMKPLTFMNLSGEAVRGMVDYFKINVKEELIVVYDDIDLEPGHVRIRAKGSAGGHNGMKNIVRMLGTQEFTRVRIGVGAKPKGWDLADYVLSRFSKEDRALIEEAIDHSCKAIRCIVEEGVDAAMNQFN